MEYYRDRTILSADEWMNDKQTPLLAPTEGTEDTISTIKEVKGITESRVRLVSLDIFRGLTIATMILVNEGHYAHDFLAHADWDGLTLADMVVPAFLFIMGVTVPLTIGWSLKRGVGAGTLWMDGFWRCTRLFLLGLFLQSGLFPEVDPEDGSKEWDYFSHFRVMGVLQRIALCFFLAITAFLALPNYCPSRLWQGTMHTWPSVTAVLRAYVLQWIAAYVLLAVYLCVSYELEVPDVRYTNGTIVTCGRGKFSAACNAVSYVDLEILTEDHMYDWSPCRAETPPCKYFEPEGLLSSVCATCSVMIGIFFGAVLTLVPNALSRIKILFASSVLWICIGVLFHATTVPFNKQLYSMSYMFFMGGVSGLCLLFFYLLIDVRPLHRRLSNHHHHHHHHHHSYTHVSRGPSPMSHHGHDINNSDHPEGATVDDGGGGDVPRTTVEYGRKSFGEGLRSHLAKFATTKWLPTLSQMLYPFEAMGKNSIVLYVGSEILADDFQARFPTYCLTWLWHHMFSEQNTIDSDVDFEALFHALTQVVIWACVAVFLDRHGAYFKI